jgi:hypothetical protein
MSRSSHKKNGDEHPSVRAARITGASAKRAAFIAAIAAILAAIVGGFWLWLSKTSTSSVEKKKFVARVSDIATGRVIRGAKVSIEGLDVPTVLFTDSEGVFSFLLSDLKKETRIRVEATGYEDYDLRVAPTENIGNQEIRLQPAKNVAIPQMPQAPINSPVTGNRASQVQKGGASRYIAECRSLFERGQYDAALRECKRALRLEPANQEAIELKSKIENTIRILNKQ